MFIVDGTNISLSRGDTGAIEIAVNGYTFGELDRAVFTIKSGSGAVVKEHYYQIENGKFTVTFYNHDTDDLNAGGYNWDVRFVIHPYYDETGRIVDGDQVLTPNLPMSCTLLTVVGDI